VNLTGQTTNLFKYLAQKKNLTDIDQFKHLAVHWNFAGKRIRVLIGLFWLKIGERL
jgi:hypothetical protein